MISRRGLFALGSAGLFLPRRLVAAESGSERKFLFLFCPGGWDTTAVFAPVFNDTTDHYAADEAATVGGFSITDSPTRPSVRSFFETWGARTCLVNGLQIPSVAHDVCTRLTMTGDSRGGLDDWVSIIAGHAGADRLLPNIHVSGPIYPNVYTSASVRVGKSGQLANLVNGEALRMSDRAFDPPPPDVEALEEAFVRRRVDAWAAAARSGQEARMAAAEQLALARAELLPAVADQLAVGSADDLLSAVRVASDALAAGLARTGMVAYGAGGNGMWDTHSNNDDQDWMFEELFSVLDTVLAEMEAAPGEQGGSLLDETTVVLLSEMGRAPEKNSAGGKDHWTWTSAMFIGSGIAGGRTVGGWDELLLGRPVDLATGEAAEGGVTLLPGHIGATLLALADIDPGEFVDETLGEPIEAVLSG